MLTEAEILTAAQALHASRQSATARERLTASLPELTLADAYRIQAAGIRLRLQGGETVVGYKMGLTSRAKREQMNLDAPVFGVLTDAMAVRDGAFALPGSIHPKIEPEIAFVTGRELRGPVSDAEALAACTQVLAALEILDSRYVGFKYFSLPDVVADNSSSSHFALGEPCADVAGLDLTALHMVMSVDGAPVAEAESSAISGHPIRSVVELCALLAAEGRALPAGSVVLAGAATIATELRSGMTVRLDVTGLPPVVVRVD